MPSKIIGFDRFIELAWLDAAAAKAAEGVGVEAVRDYLWGLLDGVLSGSSERSARHKTITVLTRIWPPKPEEHEALHMLACRLVRKASAANRLALHWSMTLAAYPFFRDVVDHIGRLTQLQEEVTRVQLDRRITEIYGDRESVRGGVRRVVRSLVRWDVLADTEEKGAYRRAVPVVIEDPQIVEVLVHGLVAASQKDAIAVDRIGHHPALFPFEISPHSVKLNKMESLERVNEFSSTYVKIKPAKSSVKERLQGELAI